MDNNGMSYDELIIKLKSMKAGTFAWKGKAKDYPGALNIKQGMTRKGKPKLRIV